jgi:hypothetical protein
MLLRKERQGTIALPQVNHAWVSGQLARAWGNDTFAVPAPREVVCLAAEQHDIGWADYDMFPDFDPVTGLPQEFHEVSESTHTALWRDGVNRARVFGRFVALLVSLHADTIYTRHFDFKKADRETAALVRRFLEDQRAFQADMLHSLESDAAFSAMATQEAIDQNRLLIAALDAMSLSICWGVGQPVPIKSVPVHLAKSTEIVLRPGNSPSQVIVDPWPFGAERVDVQAEGRRLQGPYADLGELHAAFEGAEPAVIEVTLRRA